MKSIKVCEYSRSRSFHDDLILEDQASGERSQDQWSSGFFGWGVGEVKPRIRLFLNYANVNVAVYGSGADL